VHVESCIQPVTHSFQGGIGQPLALLLKSNPLITEVRPLLSSSRSPLTWFLQLSLFDIVNTPGVAADLSHIATPSKVEGYLPANDGLKKALACADIVVIPAGVPRKPGVSLFSLVLIAPMLIPAS